MGATTSGSSGKDFKNEFMEAGVYPARCIQVVELGTSDNDWDKDDIKKRKMIFLVWEMSELMEDGRPFTVNWKGTNSIGDKSNLGKMLSSWRRKAFTPEEKKRFKLSNILDKCCMVNINAEEGKNGRTYNNVITVMPLPKGMVCNRRVNDFVDFGIHEIGSGDYDKIWPYVREKYIDTSDEGLAFYANVDKVEEDSAEKADGEPSMPF